MPDRLGGSGEKYATFTSGDRLEEAVDARVPRDGARDVAARASERPRLVLVRAEPLERAPRGLRGVGATTSPVSRSRTMSSGPPASVIVTTGFSERNASYGTSP